MFRSQTASMALLLLLIAPFATADITIKDAWIREAPPVIRVQAAYATFKNNRADNIELISATSSAFEKIEFHKTISEHGLTKMQQQTTVTIPAHNEARLEPAGMHMMLFNPLVSVRAGKKIEIHFTFSNGFKTTSNFVVRKATGIDHHQHMRH